MKKSGSMVFFKNNNIEGLIHLKGSYTYTLKDNYNIGLPVKTLNDFGSVCHHLHSEIGDGKRGCPTGLHSQF